MIFSDFLLNCIEILFGNKYHHTILSNYIIIFKVDPEISEIFVDFSGEKSQKNSIH